VDRSVGTPKLVLRYDVTELYDVARDPDETDPESATVEAFAERCRRDGAPAAAIDAARDHLRRWQHRLAATSRASRGRCATGAAGAAS
jgi:hypothetical protein